MKKLISLLAVSIIATASTSGAVSCTKAGYSQGEIGERITMITDSGRISDRSFNQSSYEAIVKYSNQKSYEDELGAHGGFDFNDRGLSADSNYVEPLSVDSFSLISAYKIAAIKGTDILVMPGFLHAGTIDKASQLLGSDKTVIFADSDLGTAGNIINLVYNSQLSGFAAGYDAAVWATTKDANGRLQGDINQKSQGWISFGTYGGDSNKLAVDNFMWGFMVAIRYFDLRIDDEIKKTSDPDQIKEWEQRRVYFANAGSKARVEDAKNIEGTNAHYFTGSFAPGDSTKKGTNQWLYDSGADVIFPIAGPQTADTLAYRDDAYIIGVDTDQSKQYTRSANRFVTSATKNLIQSICDAIDHSKANRRNWNEDGTLKKQPVVGGEYWEKGTFGGNAPPQLNWSVDIDQIANKEGSKIPKTLLDYSNSDEPRWAEFVWDMNDYFLNQTGLIIKDYMAPDKIKHMADIIFAKYNDLLPLNFPSPSENPSF